MSHPSAVPTPPAAGSRRLWWKLHTVLKLKEFMKHNPLARVSHVSRRVAQTLGMALGWREHTDWRKEEVSGRVELGARWRRLNMASVRHESHSEVGRFSGTIRVFSCDYRPNQWRLLEMECRVQTHGTDLEGFAPWICTGAARCILCEVQRMTGGTRQSLCRIWPQNLHTALCSYWEWGHRSPPWASSEFPVGKRWEGINEELSVFVYFNNSTYLSHIGWQQSLQFLDDEQTKRTSGVQQLLRGRTLVIFLSLMQTLFI